jgi:predicted nucleotidyltransferase
VLKCCVRGGIIGWMTLDPDEGVGEDNLISTGVRADRIQAKYRPLVTLATSKLASIHRDVVAVYLYGSVATGMATPPTSDLDLLAVLKQSGVEPKIRHLAAQLSERHRDLVRYVAIAILTLAEIWSDSVDELGTRCFLKYYCLPLYGVDLRRDIDPCRATPKVAWAFNHNIAEAVASAKAQLRLAESPQVSLICRASARRVILAATSLVSIVDKTWTTNRDVAARSIARLHLQWGSAAQAALRWCQPFRQCSRREGVPDGFASWVADELRRQAASSSTT